MVDERKVPEGYKVTEVGIIPEDWELVPIGDIFKFKNGLNKAKQFFGEGTPIVNYMDVYKNRGICFKDIRGKVTLTSNELANYNVQKGDVFFTRTSETPDEIGITAVLLDEPQNTTFSGFILRARPVVDVLDIDYKRYCFSADAVRKEIISKCTYTTRALTNGRVLSKVNIFVPPKPEQKSIAEALSDTDNLISSLEKLIDKKKKIKQGVMQQLLTGKKRLPGFSGEWEVKKLGEVAVLKHGYSFSSKTYEIDGKYKVVTIANVQKGFMSTTSCSTIKDLPADIQAHQQLSIDDLLISLTGNVGRVCMVNQSNCVLNQRVGKFVISEKYDFKYVYYSLNLDSFIEEMMLSAKGGAQPNLGNSDVLSYDLCIPNDIEEQKAIAQVLSDMDNEIEALEEKLEKVKTIKQGMMQELLTGRIRLI